jgi:hypothetical protein
MRWTPEADLRLFRLTLALHDVKINYEKLADAYGEGVTAKALVHRFDKIRHAGDAPNKKEDSTPRSPKKRRNQKVIEGNVNKREKRDKESSNE